MRLVLDTNTAVSGLIWGGVPGRLIDAAAAGKTQIISSVPLLDELHDVLFRKKFTAQLAEQGVDAVDLFEGCAALVHLVAPAVIGPVSSPIPMTTSCLRQPLPATQTRSSLVMHTLSGSASFTACRSSRLRRL